VNLFSPIARKPFVYIVFHVHANSEPSEPDSMFSLYPSENWFLSYCQTVFGLPRLLRLHLADPKSLRPSKKKKQQQKEFKNLSARRPR